MIDAKLKKKILNNLRAGQTFDDIQKQLKVDANELHIFISAQYHKKGGNEIVDNTARTTIAKLIFEGKGNREISNQLLIDEEVIARWREALEPGRLLDRPPIPPKKKKQNAGRTRSKRARTSGAQVS